MKFAHLAIAALVACGAGAQAAPTLDFGTYATTQLGSTPANDQLIPHVDMNPVDGSTFVVAYIDVLDIVIEVRNSTTEAIVSTATIGTGTSGYDGNGELFVTFNPTATEVIVGWGVGDDGGAAIQSFNPATGAAISAVVTVSAGFGNKPKVDFFSDGSLLVCYEGGDGVGNGSGAMMQRYTSALAPVGSAVSMSDPAVTGDQGDPSIGIIRSGSFATDIVITAWEDSVSSRFPLSAPGTDDDANYRVFDSSLTALSALTNVPGVNLATAAGPDESDKIGNPSIGIAPTGEFMLGYEAETTVSGGDETVFLNTFDASRNLASGTDAVRGNSTSGRKQPVVIEYSNSSSAFLVSWGDRGGNGVFARFFANDGSAASAEIQMNGDDLVTTDAREVSMSLFGDKGVVVWTDDDNANSYYRLFDVNSTSVNGWDLY